MAQRIRYIAGDLVIPSSFSDPLTNVTGGITNPQNLASVNNFNWIMTVTGFDPIFANPVTCNSYQMNAALSLGFGLKITQLQTAVNPLYSIQNAIVPVVMLPQAGPLRSPFYTAKKKFIQFTIIAGSNGTTGAGLMNFEDQSGVGAPAGQFAHDAYFLQFDGGLRRDNSGAAFSQLHGGVGVVQGDVWRMSFDAQATQTVLTISRNGTVNYTITDNNVNRLTGNAFPFIGVESSASTLVAEYKDFSCGLGL